MSTGPKARPGTTPRGGARPNSGPKPIFGVSEKELNGLFRALKKKAKETGKTWQDLFAGHLYSDDWREAAAYHRMLTDQIKVRKEDKHVTTQKVEGPAIFLPEERPDPAKVVPLKSVG